MGCMCSTTVMSLHARTQAIFTWEPIGTTCEKPGSEVSYHDDLLLAFSRLTLTLYGNVWPMARHTKS